MLINYIGTSSGVNIGLRIQVEIGMGMNLEVTGTYPMGLGDNTSRISADL